MSELCHFCKKPTVLYCSGGGTIFKYMCDSCRYIFIIYNKKLDQQLFIYSKGPPTKYSFCNTLIYYPQLKFFCIFGTRRSIIYTSEHIDYIDHESAKTYYNKYIKMELS